MKVKVVLFFASGPPSEEAAKRPRRVKAEERSAKRGACLVPDEGSKLDS